MTHSEHNVKDGDGIERTLPLFFSPIAAAYDGQLVFIDRHVGAAAIKGGGGGGGGWNKWDNYRVVNA